MDNSDAHGRAARWTGGDTSMRFGSELRGTTDKSAEKAWCSGFAVTWLGAYQRARGKARKGLSRACAPRD